jgi:Ca-activated chloride channel family protein
VPLIPFVIYLRQRKAQLVVRSMRCCVVAVFAWLFLLPCPASFSQQNSPPESQTIRVGVKLVSVGVIVTDASGKFVDGLQDKDFHAFDDGVEQPITYFSLDRPSHVLLMIEAGPAVYLLEGGHLGAAFALLAGLSAQDEVAVVKYAERPEVICDFSADKRLAGGALEHLNFNLGFGSLNLTESLASVLDWMERTPQDKKTIVLLASGVDTSAPAAAASVLQRLRVGDVRVLAVSVVGQLRPGPAGKKKAPSSASVLAAEEFAAADGELRDLAAATGGRAYFPTDGKGFAAAYAEIAQIVRHEYTLGFIPQHLDGKVHRIEVRVPGDGAPGGGPAARPKVNGLRVDHRQGYVARGADAP